MTPNQLWKYANSLENMSKNMRGLALIATSKHKTLESISMPAEDSLFPITFQSISNDLVSLSHSFKPIS